MQKKARNINGKTIVFRWGIYNSNAEALVQSAKTTLEAKGAKVIALSSDDCDNYLDRAGLLNSPAPDVQIEFGAMPELGYKAYSNTAFITVSDTVVQPNGWRQLKEAGLNCDKLVFAVEDAIAAQSRSSVAALG